MTIFKLIQTIILIAILYGYETWSPTLREKHRLRVLENSVLREILEPWRNEVTEEWRKLHKEKCCYLYSSPRIIRMMKLRKVRWSGNVARMGEKRNAYMLLVGKPEGRGH
jgi:hypothetical protein